MYRATREALTRHGAALGGGALSDMLSHLTTADHGSYVVRLEAVHSEDGNGKQSIYRDDRLWMNCFKNTWWQRNRDLNTAISILQQPTTDSEGAERPAR
jgi:hypothetical protein